MRNILLIQLGVGKVGKTLIKQIMENNRLIQKKWNIKLNYHAIVDSISFTCSKTGICDSELNEILDVKERNGSISDLTKGEVWVEPRDLYDELFIANKAILIDVTDTLDTLPVLLKAREKGYGLVLSNKLPLSSSYSAYQQLVSKKIGYETTVGAGLPVIEMLNKLMDTGDKVIEIKGALSGTLNFIFSQLAKGEKFSSTVKKAYQLGYTEPDPRVDLYGKDVARKALILARTLGYELNEEDVCTEPLLPKEMGNFRIKKFMDRIEILDDDFAKRINGKVHYLVSVAKERVRIGFVNLPEDSPFANLQGPENLISFKTARYNQFPLFIRGPGAGLEVTAGGLLNDIIKLSTIV